MLPCLYVSGPTTTRALQPHNPGVPSPSPTRAPINRKGRWVEARSSSHVASRFCTRTRRNTVQDQEKDPE